MSITLDTVNWGSAPNIGRHAGLRQPALRTGHALPHLCVAGTGDRRLLLRVSRLYLVVSGRGLRGERRHGKGGVARPVEQRHRVRQRVDHGVRQERRHHGADGAAVQRLRLQPRPAVQLCAGRGAGQLGGGFQAGGGGRRHRADRDADGDEARQRLYVPVQLRLRRGVRHTGRRFAENGQQYGGQGGVSMDGARRAGGADPQRPAGRGHHDHGHLRRRRLCGQRTGPGSPPMCRKPCGPRPPCR